MINQEKRIERIHKDFKKLKEDMEPIEFYDKIFRVFGNKVCGNIEGRCKIIFNKKQGWYHQLRTKQRK